MGKRSLGFPTGFEPTALRTPGGYSIHFATEKLLKVTFIWMPALLSPVCDRLIITPVALIYHIFIRLSKIVMNVCLGPVHTYPEIFVSANFFMRIHLASTRVRRIRSVYPEISVYALQSGNFCIRCVSGYVWTLVSVYFCIRWRNAHALLTNPLRCPDTNRIRVDGRTRFVYGTCGRRYFCIRIKKFAGTKISGYVWTGP